MTPLGTHTWGHESFKLAIIYGIKFDVIFSANFGGYFGGGPILFGVFVGRNFGGDFGAALCGGVGMGFCQCFGRGVV